MNDLLDNLVCLNCTSDKYLQEQICTEGSAGICDYCMSEEVCVRLEELGQWVESVLDEYFECNENNVDDAVRPEQAIETLAEVSFNIALDLVDILEGPEAVVQSGFFYREREFRSVSARGTWEGFCDMIKHRDRFFALDGWHLLEELFGKLLSMKTISGKSPFRKLRPSNRNRIYRGRVVNDDVTLHKVIVNPAVELAPPPGKITPAGRLNPTGIPVFYGAFDRGTCVAELKPFVGGEVVTGEFSLTSEILILDLTILEALILDTSFFDPEYEFKMDHVAFIRNLHAEIIKPVSPKDEQLEYLPTQYLVAYLSRVFKPSIQGIIYGSSQRGSKKKNIAIFPDSDPPTLSVHVPVPTALTSYVLTDDEKYERHHPFLDAKGYEQYKELQVEAATYTEGNYLKLVPNSLRVHKVTRVEYSTTDVEAEPTQGKAPDWNEFFGYDVKTGMPLEDDLLELEEADKETEADISIGENEPSSGQSRDERNLA